MKLQRVLSNRLSRRRRSGAFTLIELLVVILILAILAALIVPRVVGRAADAKRAKAASDIATLVSALDEYRADTDKYPTSDEGLQALVVQPSDVQNWHGPYTRKISTDPWGDDYAYVSPGPNGEDFVITSYGSDGQPGGEGDAADITSN
jgi:general secretion pathway protein G